MHARTMQIRASHGLFALHNLMTVPVWCTLPTPILTAGTPECETPPLAGQAGYFRVPVDARATIPAAGSHRRRAAAGGRGIGGGSFPWDSRPGRSRGRSPGGPLVSPGLLHP